MTLFVIFIFGSVTLGAGAMLSPAWPTSQPRMALAAALALALIVGGAVFYASLFSWNTLIIDYMLFALLVGIFLGGTLSHAQARAEAKGETLTDALQGWPGPQDLVFFIVAGLVLAWPAFALPLPLGQQAPADALLTVTTRLGGTFDTLAPLYPQVQVSQPPGFYALAAYLSKQLNQSSALIHLVLGAVLSFLCVWLAYDLGAELRDKRLGRAMAVVMLVGTGLYPAVLSAQYPALLGLLFGMAFWLYALRYKRHGHRADLVGGGLLLGAIALAEPSTSLAFFIGFIVWLITLGLEQSIPLRRWLGLFFGFSGIALLGLLPWLLRGGQPLDFARYTDDLGQLITTHAIVLPFALVGGATAFRRHWQDVADVARFMIAWLIIVILLSLFRWVYVGWVWAIAPMSIIGGMGLLEVYERQVPKAIRAWAYARYYALASALIVILVLVIVFNIPILDRVLNLSLPPLSINDIAVLQWIKKNAPIDALIVGPEDAYWIPALTERSANILPPSPYWHSTAVTASSDAPVMVFAPENSKESLTSVLYQQGEARVYAPSLESE